MNAKNKEITRKLREEIELKMARLIKGIEHLESKGIELDKSGCWVNIFEITLTPKPWTKKDETPQYDKLSIYEVFQNADLEYSPELNVYIPL